MDIATGFAMDLIPNYDSADSLWVPMTYGNIRLHRELPISFWSQAKLNREHNLGEDYATFDIELFDNVGSILASIKGFTIRKLASNFNFAEHLADISSAQFDSGSGNADDRELSPAMVRLAGQVSQGITPTEGFTLLERALATGKSQVVVSSMALATLQRAVHKRPDVGESSV